MRDNWLLLGVLPQLFPDKLHEPSWEPNPIQLVVVGLHNGLFGFVPVGLQVCYVLVEVGVRSFHLIGNGVEQFTNKAHFA